MSLLILAPSIDGISHRAEQMKTQADAHHPDAQRFLLGKSLAHLRMSRAAAHHFVCANDARAPALESPFGREGMGARQARVCRAEYVRQLLH